MAGISIASHSGKVLLIGVYRRFGGYDEGKGLQAGEQCELRPNHSTMDMIFVVCTLQ